MPALASIAMRPRGPALTRLLPALALLLPALALACAVGQGSSESSLSAASVASSATEATAATTTGDSTTEATEASAASTSSTVTATATEPTTANTSTTATTSSTSSGPSTTNDETTAACVPECAGKLCGDDGCGGECAPCPSGQVCQDDGQACVCDPTLPDGWPAAFTLPVHNPILVPTKAKPYHGSDNIYAPDIVPVSGETKAMWYGGQGGDGHDRIFVAIFHPEGGWRKWPADDDPKPALDVGGSNHVNDPSVVRVGDTWKMYYTDAPIGIDDEIWLAESKTLTGFTKTQQVLAKAPGWESEKVGRPAVLYEGGVYKMWYDGNDGKARHVGYATSDDGVHFTRHPANPVLLNAGAIDVDKIGGVYVMLTEGGEGTSWATSVDGVCWVPRGLLFGKSGEGYDAFGQVTPFLEVEGGVLRAIWFGGASVQSWDRNRIAVALPDGAAPPAASGCTGCVAAGSSCSEACQDANAPALGVCAAPGSTDPGACCACMAHGCEGCTAAADCHAACVAIGQASGFCSSPGSKDPGKCCACVL